MPISYVPDTTAIRDIAYPDVETKLNNPSFPNRYRTFMRDFVAKRKDELWASIPSKQMYYSTQDVSNWFRTTGIDRKIIKQGISGTYYAKIGNFNPSYAKDDSTIALLCMIRYFSLRPDCHVESDDTKNGITESTEEILNEATYDKAWDQLFNLAIINIAFSGKLYPSVFYKSFRYQPQQHIMQYVLNYMLTQKYDIIRYKTVIGAVRNVTVTWCNAYRDRFESFTDEDVTYLCQQLHNRLDSFIHNIAMNYYEAHKNQDSYITFDSDDVSDSNYHIADNDTFRMNLIVQNTMRELMTKSIDYQNIKRSSNDLVKFDELKSIFENVFADKDSLDMIKEFCTLMVALYFQSSTIKDITSLSFISFSIKPVPNSHNPYVIRKKELLEKLLTSNSDKFTSRRNRAATESAYFRAFNAYIALMIQKSNKM